MTAKKQSNIGQLIDTRARLKKKVKAQEEKLAEMKVDLEEVEADIDDLMKEQGLTRAAGKLEQVSYSESWVPDITDWDQYYKFIKRTGAFDLLHKRPSVTAWRERYNQGKIVPGTEPKKITKLHFTAVKSK